MCNLAEALQMWDAVIGDININIIDAQLVIIVSVLASLSSKQK